MLPAANRAAEHATVTRFSAVGISPTGRRTRPKPLLALLAISRCLAGKSRLATFEEIDLGLQKLLTQFAGRGQSAAKTFWGMQEDQVWEVTADKSTLAEWKRKIPSRRNLNGAGAQGGFPKSLDAVLRRDSELALRVMSELLDQNFSPIERDTIANVLGVPRHPARPAIVNPDQLIHDSPRALKDLQDVFRNGETDISSVVAIERMKTIHTGPWRAFGGTGLNQELLWALLMPFEVAPQPIVHGQTSVPLSGYARAAVERGARVPLERWVANIGHKPTIPKKARRIREMRLRSRQMGLRQSIISDRLTPYIVCDASGCYWDGVTVLPSRGNRPETVDSRIGVQLLNLCVDGYFGDWMKEVIIDEGRWHHIYDYLIQYRSQPMIFRDSLHLPQENSANAVSGRALSDANADTVKSPADVRRRARPFDPSRMPESLAMHDRRRTPDEILQLQEQANRHHHDVLVVLHQHLMNSGWREIQEIPGAIDLRAVSPCSGPVIFEAKTVSESNEVDQCRAALAQLLEYRCLFGRSNDDLCLVADRTLSRSRQAVLESVGIAIVIVRDRELKGLGARGERLLAIG